jgi:hypothetical protein
MVKQAADKDDVRVANDAFYKALSAGSIEGISIACAHDGDVTALHENSKRWRLDGKPSSIAGRRFRSMPFLNFR